MTTKLNKQVIAGLALSVFAVLALLIAPYAAHANPSFFANGVTTGSAATTSPAYMTPGAATSTTPTYDAYGQTFNGVTYRTDLAGLLVQFTGSSTVSVLSLSVEYSQDGVDWYRNFVIDPNQTGTTTASQAIGSPVTTTFKFASSTVGGGATVGTISTAALLIPTPFRYTRVVASITGANGAVWVQLVPIKQVK